MLAQHHSTAVRVESCLDPGKLPGEGVAHIPTGKDSVCQEGGLSVGFLRQGPLLWSCLNTGS